MRLRDFMLGWALLLSPGCGGAPTDRVVEHGAATASVVPDGPKAVAAVPLRRLTRTEYNHTVRDLLGDDTHPADAFPPDESVGGFENNTIAPVTPILAERYMDAAEALAAAAVAHLDTLAPCHDGQPADACAQRFVDSFGRLAFRRPLESSEREELLSVYREKAARSDYRAGIRLVIELILQSPQLLYRIEPALEPGADARPLTGYELATRLSYFIWASTPDAALLDDAAAGRLDSADDVERVARRMLSDRRASDAIRSFHRQWLGLRELETASKDGAFTPELRDAMVEETLRFGVEAALANQDFVTHLLTSNKTFASPALAKLYGASGAASGAAPIELPPGQRAGILTHASVLSVLASADQTSPVLRGKFVREKLLCQAIPPPPPNVVTTSPKVDPSLTTKQRFAQHRSDASCAGCHQLMDPIGFGFEHYDALGAWRTQDGSFAVDATGELSATDDVDGSFDGVLELSARLAKSQQVRRCIARQWLRFALGRADSEEDTEALGLIYQAFEKGGFTARELIVAIARSQVFRYAGAPPKKEP